MAFNNVEEVQHWPPKRIDGTRYDFSHLNAQQITYTLQATEHQSQKNYTVVVTYSYHVFAKEIPEMGEVEKQQRTYSYHGQVLRPVHDERYMLSKKLPEMIKNLLTTKCLHGAEDSFFVVNQVNAQTGIEEPYEIYFEMFKEKKKLRLHIKTAFVRRERKPEKAQKIQFATILNKTFKNQKIKRLK